ncbi:farnesol dehydrogenase-like [Condylostylus longicornis]|uniref:farnesol dehydrogenase-like n=1 Tax=Condylostylus longicornis TaxID=2530218 RepID=UPI00244DCF2A|nr:farnesol dehydrogenase-like [Condylostylus longicornis]
MNRWEKKVAVVTGASSGIGAQIVKDLIKCKITVVGLARRLHKLEELKGAVPNELQNNFHPIKCDVTKENEVNSAFEWINKTLGGTDILINNAGIIRYGRLSVMNTQDVRDVIDTNIMGIVYCTRNAVESMEKRGVDGHIIMINSIAGHFVPRAMDLTDIPSINIYPPSKFALRIMAEMYKQDFRSMGRKIKVTNLSPGLVKTEIIPESIMTLELPILEVEDVSNSILYVLSTPAHVQISELTIQPVGEKF